MFLVRRFFIAAVVAFLLILPKVCSAGLMDYPRVALFPVANQAASMSINIQEGNLSDLWGIVNYDLQQAGFDMMERIAIDKVLSEQEFSHSALVDPSTAAKLGKFLGAEYIVLCTITGATQSTGSQDATAHFTVRMIDVETARITLSGIGKGKHGSNLNEALEQAAEDALHGKRGMITMMKGGKRK